MGCHTDFINFSILDRYPDLDRATIAFSTACIGSVLPFSAAFITGFFYFFLLAGRLGRTGLLCRSCQCIFHCFPDTSGRICCPRYTVYLPGLCFHNRIRQCLRTVEKRCIIFVTDNLYRYDLMILYSYFYLNITGIPCTCTFICTIFIISGSALYFPGHRRAFHLCFTFHLICDTILRFR